VTMVENILALLVSSSSVNAR